MVQLGLVGTLTVAENVALDELFDEFGDRFAALTTWDREHHLVVTSDDADLDSLDLQGYAALAAAEIADRATDEPEARSALSLLLRLAGSRA